MPISPFISVSIISKQPRSFTSSHFLTATHYLDTFALHGETARLRVPVGHYTATFPNTENHSVQAACRAGQSTTICHSSTALLPPPAEVTWASAISSIHLSFPMYHPLPRQGTAGCCLGLPLHFALLRSADCRDEPFTCFPSPPLHMGGLCRPFSTRERANTALLGGQAHFGMRSANLPFLYSLNSTAPPSDIHLFFFFFGRAGHTSTWQTSHSIHRGHTLPTCVHHHLPSPPGPTLCHTPGQAACLLHTMEEVYCKETGRTMK